ncbi:MAG: hypothetical protein JJU28_09370 [Cyclobacteriaceae bacterium]|nr:hypothetical protein [Cyclobacteriaceae bacterium]
MRIHIFSNHYFIVAFNMRSVILILLLLQFYSCGIPIPTDKTAQIDSRSIAFAGFKPVFIEQYNGDSLIISNYLLANFITGSHFKGIKVLKTNEDSVVSAISNVLHDLNLPLVQENELLNIFSPDNYYNPDFSHHHFQRVERSVFEFVKEMKNTSGKSSLVPAIDIRKDRSSGGYAGMTSVISNYFVTFMVFIFNNDGELIYKNISGIHAKPREFAFWEEALAYPIERTLTNENFEEMIFMAIRDYLGVDNEKEESIQVDE